ncbi:MAG: type 1 glutamine amidotransferase [Fibrobacter sp.]|nr:type 1 glutamine amidotransferase [Fibrobacter sp.]
MIKIHLLQHVPFETPGYFLTLPGDEFSISVSHIYKGDTLPDQSTYDLLVILGGPMNVDEHNLYPWLESEKEYIRNVIDTQGKVLGICLGAQLIASALGAKVTKNRYKEIGWFPIRKTASGRSSKLLQNIPDSCLALHWHGDTFDIPQNANHDVSSDACTNQLFTYNNRVIGMQFHFEATKQSIDALIDNCSSELVPGTHIQDADTIKKLADEYCNHSQKYLSIIIRNLIHGET